MNRRPTTYQLVQDFSHQQYYWQSWDDALKYMERWPKNDSQGGGDFWGFQPSMFGKTEKKADFQGQWKFQKTDPNSEDVMRI